MFSTSSESLCSPPAWKSMYSLNSGSELAMSCPSLLSMFPLTGFTSTLSFFSLSATAIQ